MLKWIIRVLLLRFVLRRFWMFGILYAVARRFLPAQKGASVRDDRRRGYA
jgi:hypothetical protein